MMTTAPSKEVVFEQLRDLTGGRIRRSAEKYALNCPGPLSDPDDFEQNVYLKLYEWLDDPVHLDQAEGLLEDSAEALRFMQQFTRARICDQIDMICSVRSDQRLTFHAIKKADRPVPFSEPLSIRIDEIKRNLHWLSAALLDALIDPPAQVREAFLESRTKVSKGIATLAEPMSPHEDCILRLTRREHVENTVISWSGPIRRGRLDTSVGPARLSVEGSDIVIWFESKLFVRLDRHSLEGEFVQESIRPSRCPFDLGVMADYLGSKQIRLRFAWDKLRDALGVEIPSRYLEVP